MNQHDPEFEELAAGSALDALERADEERFRIHLAGCNECQKLLAQFRGVAAVLPDSLDEVSASPAVKARLMERVRDDRGPAARGPAAVPLQRQARHLPSVWLLPLAASLLVLIGLGTWNLELQRELAAARAEQTGRARIVAALQAGGRAWGMSATPDSPGASGVVVYDPGTGQLLLSANGLPPLRQDQAYEAWVLRGGAMAPAGLSRVDAGGSVTLPIDAQPDQIGAVALSLEPANGSDTPTGPVMLLAKL